MNSLDSSLDWWELHCDPGWAVDVEDDFVKLTGAVTKF
jgi:hypothetical protein